MDDKRQLSQALPPRVSDDARAAFLRCWVASASAHLEDYSRADFLTIDRFLSPIILGDPLAARVAFRRCQAKMRSHLAYVAEDWGLVEAALFGSGEDRPGE